MERGEGRGQTKREPDEALWHWAHQKFITRHVIKIIQIFRSQRVGGLSNRKGEGMGEGDVEGD